MTGTDVPRFRPLPGALVGPAVLVLFAGMATVPFVGNLLNALARGVAGLTLEDGWARGVLTVITVWTQNAAWVGLTLAILGSNDLRRGVASLSLSWPGWTRFMREMRVGFRWGLLLLAANAALARLSVAVLSRFFDQKVVLERMAREQGALLSLFHPDQPRWLLAVLFFTVAVVAPVGEEVLFRGFLHRAFRGRVGGPAVWLSSAVFAAAHLYVVHFLAVFALGALLATLYERRGSLWAPIAAHAVANGIVAGVFLASGGGASG